MTKVLAATCENEIVKIGDLVISDVVILSKGLGSSEGCIFVDKDKYYYVANTTSDLELTIEKLVDSITKIGVILTSIGVGMTGPTTAPPPTLATDVLELNSIATELNTLKGTLK